MFEILFVQQKEENKKCFIVENSYKATKRQSKLRNSERKRERERGGFAIELYI